MLCRRTASGIVVEMTFDVATHNASKCSDEIVNLPWICAADGVGDSDSVDTNLVNCFVDGEQVDQIRSERVFGREANFDAFGLDKFDHFERRFDNPRDVLAVGMLHEERRGADNDVQAVDACLYRNFGVGQRTPREEIIHNTTKHLKNICLV